ncbi:jg11498 [Pararge aegeria aegeria]|uniref:Jg11498 protein n=1 Tax=Pararge aegeria aegeria TaxID=348720 RepID=A0A8S4RQ13_9NEOP|nr:jg11498 [Pararge aegeria aegeria]
MTWIAGDGQQLELEVCGRARAAHWAGGGGKGARRHSAVGARSTRLSAPSASPAARPRLLCRRSGAVQHAPRARPRAALPRPRRLRAPLVTRNARDYAFYVYSPECKYLWMSVFSCLDWL